MQASCPVCGLGGCPVTIFSFFAVPPAVAGTGYSINQYFHPAFNILYTRSSDEAYAATLRCHLSYQWIYRSSSNTLLQDLVIKSLHCLRRLCSMHSNPGCDRST
jgi:hypothetical protein